LVPEYASLAEAGVKDFNLEIWNAVAAPKSMPPQVVARLSVLLAEIARRPEIREKLFQQGWQVTGTTAEGLARRVQADAQTLGDVIRTHHITAQ
jgi:tripartite-type tricarboxylate transporter receptor subunit TctC